jgi:hypothetical protein
MNSSWAPLFVAGSLLVLTTDIAAQEQAVLGQGNVSCGSWLNDRKGDDTSTHFHRSVIRAGDEFENRMNHLAASWPARNDDSGY